ncbi:MAG: phenylacetate--CoA ligase [Spirochaetales bacterium]|nr:phenylacetate--CoA ligase [Spirochaetales bacterium]
MMWNEKIETMSREEKKKLQSERLVAQVKKLYETVPFYKKRMDEKGVTPADIQSIEDISKLPFMTKDDLREVYPHGLLAVKQEDIVEVHMSSGTTGKPVVMEYTRKDIDDWAEAVARALAMNGVSSSSTIQVSYGYGLFTGGFGIHHGGQKIGASVIPMSGGNTKKQLQVLQDFQPEYLACTPSYAMYLAEAAIEEGIVDKLNLKYGIFGAEPWSEAMRKEIESKLNIKALDIYGLTEISGPGVAMECEYQDMLHVADDLFYPEIINPETGEVLPFGEKGELVFTTLTKEGTPVLRYRTKDITFLSEEKCKCGRTTIRMHRLMGRTDDMLIIRGVNVFPSQIEEVLLKIEGVEPHYQLVVERKGNLDTLEVQVEMSDKLFSDSVGKLEEVAKEIERNLYATLSIHAKITLVEPKSIPRSEGKAKRVIDKRTI